MTSSRQKSRVKVFGEVYSRINLSKYFDLNYCASLRTLRDKLISIQLRLATDMNLLYKVFKQVFPVLVASSLPIGLGTK